MGTVLSDAAEQQIIAAISEFVQIVDIIYGIYLDSTLGFALITGKQNEMRQQQAEKLHFTPKQSDNSHLIYGNGDPNNPESYTVHQCTLRELKERNAIDGLNSKTIGNLCLVLLDQYWEDHYRGSIEKAAGLSKIESNVWGDIRHLRRSIIHHRGIAIGDVDKCSILTWFKAGDEISISSKQFEMLVSHVKIELNELPQKIRDMRTTETER